MAAAEIRADAEIVAEACDPIYYAPLLAPRPVLMVNGLKDTIIPPALGYMLCNSLQEPRRAIWYDGERGEIPRERCHDMRSFLLQTLRPGNTDPRET